MLSRDVDRISIFIKYFEVNFLKRFTLLTVYMGLYLYDKRRYVCLSVCLFRIAGQTAGPIETKLDTRTHVQPGSVSGKVNVNVIHVCLRE